MKKVQLKKFGTFFNLFIFEKKFSEKNIESLKNEIENIFEDYENIFSIFRKNSEISKINLEKKGQPSKIFFELFEIIEKINFLTNGYFSPFIENKKNFNIENKKFFNEEKNFFNIKKIFGVEKKIFEFKKNFSIKEKKFFLEKNINLDFGGIGKGFFVDLISKKLKKQKITNFLINFGGDIYTYGEMGKNKKKNKKEIGNKSEKIRIGIQNPFLKNENIGYIDLKNQSVSSSGRYFKNWEIEGKKYHHIVNPFTNGNEIEIQMVTIIGKTTYFTDAIATAVFNMGIVKGMEFLGQNKIDGIIIGDNKKAFLTQNFRKKFNFNSKK